MTKPKSSFDLRVVEKGERLEEPGLCLVIDQDINFEADMLEALDVGGCMPVHYDLLVLCAAVEFADKHWKRPTDWHRSIHISMPVIELSKWCSEKVMMSLNRALRHLTGDTWKFTFVQSQNLKPFPYRQLQLDISDEKSFVVAYSEGLDSRAVAALCGEKGQALCIRVTKTHNEIRYGENFFTQIPFTVKNRGGRESSFRSRSFQFAALTSIAAHIRKIKRVVVPESGQGALGPAMLPLHRLYADYRNHPTFFRMMECFVKELLEHDVQFSQPRLWFTKGQTLTAFLQLPDRKMDDLLDTRSCWQTRHVVNGGGKRRQCGLCAACLLRRFSLLAAGVHEPTKAYVIWNLKASDVFDAMCDINDENDRDNMIEYGIVAVRHFQNLAEMATHTDDELSMFTFEIARSLEQPEAEILKNMKTLLSQHASEWETFLAAQGRQSFLNRWIGRGSHD